MSVTCVCVCERERERKGSDGLCVFDIVIHILHLTSIVACTDEGYFRAH